MEKFTLVIGRVLVAHIFLLAGLNKIGQYAGTQGYMEAMGVPGSLLPLVIALEVGAGLALLVGFKAKWAAWILAGFTAIAAVIFHSNFADQMQMILFMKNWTIVGGLLLIAAYGAGPVSVDQRIAGTARQTVANASA